MKWLGNVRYPPETMTDLSDAEWIKNLRQHHGEENIVFFKPRDGGNPWHSAAEWERRGMMGVYLKQFNKFEPPHFPVAFCYSDSFFMFGLGENKKAPSNFDGAESICAILPVYCFYVFGTVPKASLEYALSLAALSTAVQTQ